MKAFYKTTDPEFIAHLYELINQENQRRMRLLADFEKLGVEPVLLCVKKTTPRAVIGGPRMIGVPVPANPQVRTLPGWERVYDARVEREILVPAAGGEGDAARQFLATHAPTDVRGALQERYGIPRYLLSRSGGGLWALGYVCSPEAVWVCLFGEEVEVRSALPTALFAEVSQDEGEAAAKTHGWGWPVLPGYLNDERAG